MTELLTPLLDPSSPLNDAARSVVKRTQLAELAKAETLPTDDPRDPKRRQRVEWTRDEMVAQPAAIIETIERERAAIRDAARTLSTRSFDRAYLIGCGDSLAAMIGLRALLERLLGIPCEPMQSLDFAYYHAGQTGSSSVVVALSSSGETTRTVEGLLMAATRGAATLGLTNTEGSTLASEADLSLLIHATRRGWPTQASTAAMALLAQFAADYARARGDGNAADHWDAELSKLPDQIDRVLIEHEQTVSQLAHQERQRPLYLYAGGGPAYACALFGAAKVKECSPAHAIAMPLEEYHHYNSQKAGDPLWLVAPAGSTVPRALDTARAGKRAGGHVFAVVTGPATAFDEVADAVLRLPDVEEPLSPIVYTVPVQMFAYHVATEKFRIADGDLE